MLEVSICCSKSLIKSLPTTRWRTEEADSCTCCRLLFWATTRDTITLRVAALSAREVLVMSLLYTTRNLFILNWPSTPSGPPAPFSSPRPPSSVHQPPRPPDGGQLHMCRSPAVQPPGHRQLRPGNDRPQELLQVWAGLLSQVARTDTDGKYCVAVWSIIILVQSSGCPTYQYSSSLAPWGRTGGLWRRTRRTTSKTQREAGIGQHDRLTMSQ